MKEKTSTHKEQTIIIIENAVSETAKETVQEKLRRLILVDAEDLVKFKAS
ncbi:MAG: hypothetical protein LUC38_03250 [Oscillospiraceae bacterium]|nr:hypothetical protein [Ruminococcus sp.]MCD8344959.1 hypothetical protein [Oscillospiraceae bacterium]